MAVYVTYLRSSLSVSPDIGFTLALKAQRNDPVLMGRINVAGELNPSIVMPSLYIRVYDTIIRKLGKNYFNDRDIRCILSSTA
jgi:hypothetical protein